MAEAVCEFSVIIEAPFLAYALDAPSSRWVTHARICSGCARGALFWFPSCILYFVVEETFRKLFDDSTFDLSHGLLSCRRSQEPDWSGSSFFRLFPGSYAEGAVKEVECFAVLSRSRGTDGELLPSETLPGAIISYFSEEYFCYRDTVSAVARYRSEVPSLWSSDSDAPAASPDYHVDVEHEAKQDLADSNAAGDPLKHVVLRTKFTALREACRHAESAVPSSIVDVVDFPLSLFQHFLPALFPLIICCCVPTRCLSCRWRIIPLWRS